MIQVYTDGGCSGNPGPGGWAYVIIGAGDEPLESCGGEKATTNNRMEIQAVIAALERVKKVIDTQKKAKKTVSVTTLESLPKTAKKVSDTTSDTVLPISEQPITVYTDSQYVQKGITEWIRDWKRRGWLTSAKQPVKNQDLWQRLDALSAKLPVTWVWVRGHAGDEYNERCDSLTRKAIDSL